MSRLHRQKLRLRSMQRAEGLIEPDGKAIDREALELEGSTHSHHFPDANGVDDDDDAPPSSAPKKKKSKRKKAKR